MDALDGNAIGGLLIDVFGAEMTATASICGTCGATRPVAELVVYRQAPGTVVRCRTCSSVLMVFVKAHGVTGVDLSGLASLSQPGSALIPADGKRQPCMPNEHADKEQGRDQYVTRTVHVDVGRAAERVHVDVGRAAERVHVDGPAGPGVHVDGPAGPGAHVDGPAGPGAHVDGPAGPRLHMIAGSPHLHW